VESRVRINLPNPAPSKWFTEMPAYPWLVMSITCIGAFMGQLDASIVQLTLPVLERDFHATLASVSWVAIGYLLSYAATLPVFARASEIFGRKLLYIAGYAVFAAASLLCGLATSLPILIGCRLLQGIGGGLLGANSITILTRSVAPERRGQAMGFYAASQAIGISAGPFFGGLLLGTIGWRWVFWVSAPFALAGAVLGWFILPQTTSSGNVKQFDHWGAMLLSPALAAFVISLSELGTWRPEAVLLMMFVTVILLPAFIWRERSLQNPLIDFGLFRVSPFLGGIIGVSASYGLLYAMFLVMSFAFARGFHESPISAGLHLAIIPIMIGITAPISGRLYEKFGSRTLTTTGMTLASMAIIVLASGSDGMNRLVLTGALAFFGIGLGLYVAPNNAATMAAAPDGHSTEAGGLLNLTRVLGCMSGIVVGSSALAWRLRIDTGIGKRTTEASTHQIMNATHQALWALLFFSILAGAAALLRKGDISEDASTMSK
jgi:EmrB/QacA subfamily drug resistance transporter